MSEKKKRSRVQIPEKESKADRFIRVVTPRVVRAMKSIRVIGYCSGAAYDFTPQAVEQIVDALANELKVMGDKFSSKSSAVSEFTIKKT